MIKINLCPIDELQSPFWYVPDLVVAACVAAAAFFGMQYYLGTVQDEIDTVSTESTSLLDNTAKLQPDLVRFKNLGSDIEKLNGKLQALQSITVSKIAKYQPVIVLEHLQSLKPDGLWFDSLRIGMPERGKDAGSAAGAPLDPTAANQASFSSDLFEVKGQAFDSILTAEFMTAVRSTGSQEADGADLRTQLYFDGLSLVEVQIAKGGNKMFPELSAFPEFSIKGHFRERSTAPGARAGKDGKANPHPLPSPALASPPPDVSRARPSAPAARTL